MTFPTIHNIADVLPFVEGRPEFAVRNRDGYTSIDYIYADKDTFDCPVRRECRGLKFDAETGNLIARPFHKFFNLGERPDETPDFSGEHCVMEKLDGSMIHPASVNGELVFMTRAGVTEQSRAAMAAAKALPYGADLLRFCQNAAKFGFTPIFEYTAPTNQIVVRYSEPSITLLAIRENADGSYDHENLTREVAEAWGIPHVRVFDGLLATDTEAFVHHARSLPDTEGYVVKVGQQFVKVKADAYVASHRAKSGLLWEKDVLRLALEAKVDDVAALLSDDEATRLRDWTTTVLAHIGAEARRYNFVMSGLGQYKDDRKTFAESARYVAQAGFNPSFLFSMLDGREAYEVIADFGLKQTSSGTKARAFLASLGVPEWQALPSVAQLES